MTEEDIKLQYITPAILSKWNVQNITMETKIEENVTFTDGKINIQGNVIAREKPKKADYVLYLNSGTPIAIVEAKDNNHSISHGLQQAKTYAQMLDVPFAFSSNGDGFAEHDYITGLERQFSMEEFPSPEDLVARYKKEEKITPEEEKVISEPFYTGQNTYLPRYYQRVAVNRTLTSIARGQKRLLLAMATGTGKTYTAFQIVWRLLQTGLIHKVLYLADRNILVDQSIQQDFAPLQKVIHKVNFAKDDKTILGSYQVYFSLYQQLAGDTENEEAEGEDAETSIKHFEALFDKNFFDLIIVDECHRGSAKADSNWRAVLDYFKGATQIGMTATPKETKYVSNIDYFGKPVYTYSLKQGVDDGFLAPFRVINAHTNIGEGWRPIKGQKDKFGNEIEDRIYTNSDFDTKIILEDRRHQVAEEITKYLRQTDRMAKTIVFCATEEHAEAMRIELNNLNADMVAKNSDYVVRITGSDTYGKSKLDYFISVGSPYPVIATTSKLLSTGADCKMTKLIVLDEMIGSMTEFKQIIGRGTRIREKEGKMHFTVMDFRNVTRLFADPAWDGPIEQDPNWPPKEGAGNGNGSDDGGDEGGGKTDDPPIPTAKPIVDRNGCKVEITGKTVSIYDASGKLLRQENIIDYTKSNIKDEYATLENFITKWSEADKKIAITEALKNHGIDLQMLKNDQGMTDVDDFDFICHVAFDKKPLTRRERAENVQKRDFLSKYSGVARQVLEALIERYKNDGIYQIEESSILRANPFNKFGSPSNIAKAFGGNEMYYNAIKELEEELYHNAA